jgi:hypothetical protein
MEGILDLVRFLNVHNQWLVTLDLNKTAHGRIKYNVPDRSTFYKFAGRLGKEKMLEKHRGELNYLLVSSPEQQVFFVGSSWHLTNFKSSGLIFLSERLSVYQYILMKLYGSNFLLL